MEVTSELLGIGGSEFISEKVKESKHEAYLEQITECLNKEARLKWKRSQQRATRMQLEI